MYTCTVSKHYESGLLVISKKIIVVDISCKICNLLDTLRLLGFKIGIIYTFRRDLLSRVSFLYAREARRIFFLLQELRLLA